MFTDAWNDFKVALGFLTRLPVRHPWEDDSLAASVTVFPLVGAVVGLAGALGYGAASGLGLAPLPAAAIALGVTIGLTGALHEDGLADTVDALGGATRDDRLRIMRDSRVGSYGAIALTLGLIARAGAIVAIAEPVAVGAALIAAGASSRATLPMVMTAMPPARANGLAAGVGRPHLGRAVAAIAIAMLLVALVVPPPAAIAALVGAGTAAAAMAVLAWRRFGGQTGDVLGAVQQAAEVATLLAVSAAGAAGSSPAG